MPLVTLTINLNIKTCKNKLSNCYRKKNRKKMDKDKNKKSTEYQYHAISLIKIERNIIIKFNIIT